MTSIPDGSVVTVTGYYSPGDGGGGAYQWQSTSTAGDDGGAVIEPTAATGAGRWLLVSNGQPLSIAQWGATPDGQLDTSRSTGGTTGLKEALRR
jgi:hypothetical protein